MGFHEADTGDPIVILVLGPMDPKGGDPIPRTVRLKKIIEAAVSQLKREYSNEKFEVQAPEDLKAGPIITAILDLIEGADLIIADLAENSPSVAYEVAIVQALGIPMILVTGERGVPFYFTTSLYIGEFVIDTEVDLRTPENVKSKFYNSLIERLRDFVGALCKIRDSSTGEKAYKYANERIKPYVTNQLTEHFGDLPIVDIAGPSSLAAGYYLNAVSRFAWPDRFFDGKFFLNPVPRDGEEAAPAEVASEISKFFIVFPPEPMSNYPDDNKKLQNMLEKNGFRIEQRVIRDPFNKLRPYTGSFLAKENGGLLDPAIVLEIPTTLYALQRVPRVRRLAKHPRRDALRRRRIDGMLSSGSNLTDESRGGFPRARWCASLGHAHRDQLYRQFQRPSPHGGDRFGSRQPAEASLAVSNRASHSGRGRHQRDHADSRGVQNGSLALARAVHAGGCGWSPA